MPKFPRSLSDEDLSADLSRILRSPEVQAIAKRNLLCGLGPWEKLPRLQQQIFEEYVRRHSHSRKRR